MDNFRFTPFNIVMFFVLGLTAAMAVVRAKTRPEANWPLGYYVPALACALGFRYSLNPWIVAAGPLFAILGRPGRPGRAAARIAEFAVLAYAFARCVALLLMW